MFVGRVAVLDELVRMHDACSTGFYLSLFKGDDPELHETLIDRRFCRSIDWNPVLGHYNEKMDGVLTAISQEDYEKGTPFLWLDYQGIGWRDPRIQIYRANHYRLKQDASMLEYFSTHSDPIEGVPLWSPPIADCYMKAHKCLLFRRLFQIAARLTVWRQQHGEWPDSLDQLLTLADFREAPSNLLIDPFSGSQLQYSLTNEGFELRSVAENTKLDDGGQLVYSGSYVGDEKGDDYILRWPDSPE